MRSFIFATAVLCAVLGCSDGSGTSPHSDGGSGSGCVLGDECAQAGAGGAAEGGADSGCTAGSECDQAGQAGAPDGGSNPGVSLTITPSGTNGTLQIHGPTEFTAVLVNGSGDITWSVTGGGKLSATSGSHVLFSPPGGSAKQTLSASAAGASASVEISSSPLTISGATIPNLTASVTV